MQINYEEFISAGRLDTLRRVKLDSGHVNGAPLIYFSNFIYFYLREFKKYGTFN